MKKSKYIFLGLCLLPTFVLAQKNEFQKEFMKVNAHFNAENNILVAQKYSFSLDSLNAAPFDSTACIIQKNDNVMTTKFNGIESLTDDNYIIKLNNPDKYIIVSKNNHFDSLVFNPLITEGLSGFKHFEKKQISTDLISWKLSGGIDGVDAIEIIIDSREFRIRAVISILSVSHPLLIRFNTKKDGLSHRMFVRIDYAYSQAASTKQPQFSDYIHVENGIVTPAEKFKNYQLKFVK